MRACWGKSAREDVLICQYPVVPRVIRFLWLLPAMLATTFGCWSRMASASSVSGLWLKTTTQRSVASSV